jgi:excisionase family DNA binding protein
MTDAPKYLRAGEIARLFGVSLRTVRRWIAEEVLPSVKLGGVRLVGRGSNVCSHPRHGTGQIPLKKSKKNRRLAPYRENTQIEHVPSFL